MEKNSEEHVVDIFAQKNAEVQTQVQEEVLSTPVFDENLTVNTHDML